MSKSQTLGIEDLIPLLKDLHLAGYDIGTQQYINCQRLLLSLAAQGQHPENSANLQTLLAPILCSSAKEQEHFYEYFPQWLARQPASDPDEQSNVEGPKDQRPQKVKENALRMLRSKFFIVPVSTSLMILIAVLFLWATRPRNLYGSVINEENKPVAGARVSFTKAATSATTEPPVITTNAEGKFFHSYAKQDTPNALSVSHPSYMDEVVSLNLSGREHTLPAIILRPKEIGLTDIPEPKITPPKQIEDATPQIQRTASPDQSIQLIADSGDYLDSIKLSVLVLPLLLFGVWWLWRLYRNRRMLLQKRQSAQTPRLEHLTVKGAAEQLFQSQAFRRTVHDLRRHRRRESRDLDESATIDATIRRGGLFTPLYGARKTLPEYLALIERVGPRDQQARFSEELLRRLVQDSLVVDQYDFRGDPRICHRRVEGIRHSATHVTLPDLAARHSDYYLLIFSDGRTFINPVTGEPETWLEQFSPWPGRALFTTESPRNWSYREWALQELDFLVLRFGREGLQELSETLNSGTAPGFQRHSKWTQPFPEMLRERPHRWLEDAEPSKQKVDALLQQLRAYLGDDGMTWLGACAVYPALHWDLTVYLGFQLIADRKEFEQGLRSLVSLPWLRYGSMPDWLRTKLIAALPSSRDRVIRRALEDLLMTMLDPPAEGLRLDYSTREKDTERKGIWTRLRDWRKTRRKRESLRALISSEEIDSPFQDYVFLTFMSGRRPRLVDFSIPDLLRRVLFPRGLQAVGLRPVAVFACAAFFSVAGWTTLSLIQSANIPPVSIASSLPGLLNLQTDNPFTTAPPVESGPCANLPSVSITADNAVEGERASFAADFEVGDAIVQWKWNVRDDTGRIINFKRDAYIPDRILVDTAGLAGRTLIAQLLMSFSRQGFPDCSVTRTVTARVRAPGEVGALRIQVAVKGYPSIERNPPRVTFGNDVNAADIDAAKRTIQTRAEMDGYFFSDVGVVCTVNPPLPNSPDGIWQTCEALAANDLMNRTIGITYTVDSGRRFVLTEVRITGTNKLSYDEIADQLQTKRAVGGKRGFTSIETLERDIATIRSIMQRRGYPDAAVQVQQGVTIDGNSLIITFHVEEKAKPREPVVSLPELGLLNSRVINLKQPEYPARAKQLGIGGTVGVKVMVIPPGKLYRIAAVSGHGLLRDAAVNATRQVVFDPELIKSHPEGFAGQLSYTFTAPKPSPR